jgi:Bacterial lectin
MARRSRNGRGPPLVNETFRRATAVPRFRAFGAACLTGAPRGAAPPPGEHPLGGCTSTPVGPVPPGSGSPFGYLQLTDASNDQVGAALFDSRIPSSNGLQVTFEQWQYGNNPAFPPADGISFFLTDGVEDLDRPGAFGGSLGYAQKLPDDNPANPFLPGVDHGYLGIGLDVLGNYFGDWEQRGNGCAERSPAGTVFRIPAPGANMVTVRGPGDGTVGYCFLTATTSNFTTTGPWPSTLPGQLQGTLTAIPPGTTPEQAQALLEPSKRTVRIRITPAPNPQVTIDLDFQDGQGFQRVLAFAAPQPEPASYRFGFAASTGLFTDVHLIRNVTVSTLTPLRPNADPRRRHRHRRAVTVQRNRSTVDLHVHSRHRGLGVNRQDHRDRHGRSRHHRR